MFNGYNQPLYESDPGRDGIKKPGQGPIWYGQPYYNQEAPQPSSGPSWPPKYPAAPPSGKCACPQCQGSWYHKEQELPGASNPDLMLLGATATVASPSDYPADYTRIDPYLRSSVQPPKQHPQVAYPQGSQSYGPPRVPAKQPITPEYSPYEGGYMRSLDAPSYARKPPEQRSKYWDPVNGALYPPQQYKYPPASCRYPPYSAPYYSYPGGAGQQYHFPQPQQPPQFPQQHIPSGSQSQQPQLTPPQQYYGIVPNPMRQMQPGMEPVYYKQDNSKVSPLRLMRKKKSDSIEQLSPPRMSQSSDGAPLDVRRFFATWDDVVDDSPSAPQMVVLDCQNINEEDAELLRVYEQSTSIRLIQEPTLMEREPTETAQPILHAQLLEGVKRAEEPTGEPPPPPVTQTPVATPAPVHVPVVVSQELPPISDPHQDKSEPVPVQEEVKEDHGRLSVPSPDSPTSRDSLPVLADLPTSEYRSNKFLDYDPKSFPQFPMKKIEDPGAAIPSRPESAPVLGTPNQSDAKKVGKKRGRKPTIKFSIQKSHDLKISLRVMNDNKNEGSSEALPAAATVAAEDSHDLFTFRVEDEDDLDAEDPRAKRPKKMRKRRTADDAYSVSPEERSNEISSQGFQVQESPDSAKIKLTFKRRKQEADASPSAVKRKRGRPPKVRPGAALGNGCERKAREEHPAADTTTDHNGHPPDKTAEPEYATPQPNQDRTPRDSESSSPKITSSCHITSPRTSTDSIERELQAIWNGGDKEPAKYPERLSDNTVSSESFVTNFDNETDHLFKDKNSGEQVSSNDNVVDFYTEDISTDPLLNVASPETRVSNESSKSEGNVPRDELTTPSDIETPQSFNFPRPGVIFHGLSFADEFDTSSSKPLDLRGTSHFAEPVNEPRPRAELSDMLNIEEAVPDLVAISPENSDKMVSPPRSELPVSLDINSPVGEKAPSETTLPLKSPSLSPGLHDSYPNSLERPKPRGPHTPDEPYHSQESDFDLSYSCSSDEPSPIHRCFMGNGVRTSPDYTYNSHSARHNPDSEPNYRSEIKAKGPRTPEGQPNEDTGMSPFYNLSRSPQFDKFYKPTADEEQKIQGNEASLNRTTSRSSIDDCCDRIEVELLSAGAQEKDEENILTKSPDITMADLPNVEITEQPTCTTPDSRHTQEKEELIPDTENASFCDQQPSDTFATTDSPQPTKEAAPTSLQSDLTLSPPSPIPSNTEIEVNEAETIPPTEEELKTVISPDAAIIHHETMQNPQEASETPAPPQASEEIGENVFAVVDVQVPVDSKSEDPPAIHITPDAPGNTEIQEGCALELAFTDGKPAVIEEEVHMEAETVSEKKSCPNVELEPEKNADKPLQKVPKRGRRKVKKLSEIAENLCSKWPKAEHDLKAPNEAVTKKEFRELEALHSPKIGPIPERTPSPVVEKPEPDFTSIMNVLEGGVGQEDVIESFAISAITKQEVKVRDTSLPAELAMRINQKWRDRQQRKNSLQSTQTVENDCKSSGRIDFNPRNKISERIVSLKSLAENELSKSRVSSIPLELKEVLEKDLPALDHPEHIDGEKKKSKRENAHESPSQSKKKVSKAKKTSSQKQNKRRGLHDKETISNDRKTSLTDTPLGPPQLDSAVANNPSAEKITENEKIDTVNHTNKIDEPKTLGETTLPGTPVQAALDTNYDFSERNAEKSDHSSFPEGPDYLAEESGDVEEGADENGNIIVLENSEGGLNEEDELEDGEIVDEDEDFILVEGEGEESYLVEGLLVEISQEAEGAGKGSLDAVANIPLPPGSPPKENCFGISSWQEDSMDIEINATARERSKSPFVSDILDLFRNPSPPSTPRIASPCPIAVNPENPNFMCFRRHSLEFCDTEANEFVGEALPDEAGFQDVMESCLANARKFLSIEDSPKVPEEKPMVEDFSSDLTINHDEKVLDEEKDLQSLVCSPIKTPFEDAEVTQPPENLENSEKTIAMDEEKLEAGLEKVPDAEEEVVRTLDVLLPSFDAASDQEATRSAEVSLNASPFHSTLGAEILPVDNWPYLEEEVPMSPQWQNKEENATRSVEALDQNETQPPPVSTNPKPQNSLVPELNPLNFPIVLPIKITPENVSSPEKPSSVKTEPPDRRTERMIVRKHAARVRRKTFDSVPNKRERKITFSSEREGTDCEAETDLKRLKSFKCRLSLKRLSSTDDEAMLNLLGQNAPKKDAKCSQRVASPTKPSSEEVIAVNERQKSVEELAQSPITDIAAESLPENNLKWQPKVVLSRLSQNKANGGGDHKVDAQKKNSPSYPTKPRRIAHPKASHSKESSTAARSGSESRSADPPKPKPQKLKSESERNKNSTEKFEEAKSGKVRIEHTPKNRKPAIVNPRTEDATKQSVKSVPNEKKSTDKPVLNKLKSRNEEQQRKPSRSSSSSKSHAVAKEVPTPKVPSTSKPSSPSEKSSKSRCKDPLLKNTVPKSETLATKAQDQKNKPSCDKNAGASSDDCPTDDEGPWSCGVCGFNNVSEQQKHIQEHSFHCQSCHLAFKSEGQFIRHLTRRHKEIRKMHHCLMCEMSFDTDGLYYGHLESREHRHLEAVEKNTIHTLFTLLSGQPCPVLGPVEQRPEWLPSQAGTVHFYHQATPLSLAMQYWKMRQGSAVTK